MRRSDFIIASFLKRSNARASWQLLTTLLPIAGLWCLIARIDHASVSGASKIFALIPVLGLLALLSSRAFSLMHDCGHESLFRWRWLNRSIGFFLGVLNAIPQYPWSRDHAFHHRHNGNWEIYRGPIDVLTLDSYQQLSKRSRLLYAISRHWLMLFPGGFYYLVIKPRLALINAIINFIWSIGVELLDGLRNKKFAQIFVFSSRFRLNDSGYGNSFWEVVDLICNNLLVIISWILMSRWLGVGMFLSCYSIVMTASAAIFICIFFVQHNFKDSYASRTEDWSQFFGAIEGSSNLDLPDWLNWFFADISFHSIHHLCDRIPNYNLRACHVRNQHLLKNAMILRLQDIPKCFDYILWDDRLQELTTIDAARKLEDAPV